MSCLLTVSNGLTLTCDKIRKGVKERNNAECTDGMHDAMNVETVECWLHTTEWHTTPKKCHGSCVRGP